MGRVRGRLLEEELWDAAAAAAAVCRRPRADRLPGFAAAAAAAAVAAVCREEDRLKRIEQEGFDRYAPPEGDNSRCVAARQAASLCLE